MSKAVAAGARGEAQAFPGTKPGATCPCEDPHRKLRAGVFFDGTSKDWVKDAPKGEESNVVRMWKLWREGGDAVELRVKTYIDGVGSMDMGKRTKQAGAEIKRDYRWYIPGSGLLAAAKSGGSLVTDLGGNVAGLVGGAGGKARLNRAYFWLRDRCREVAKTAPKSVDVYGWSRGASLSRTFVNLVNMALRKHEPAVWVRVVGIWDTVGSFGMPGDASDPGQNLYVDATDAKVIIHQTARHETRHNFKLVIVPGVDREYAGEHTDVGGGHPPKDKDGRVNHVTFICLKDMHTGSARAGVAVRPLASVVPAGLDIEALRKEADKYASGGAVLTAPGSPYLAEQAAFFKKYIHVSSSEEKSNWIFLSPYATAKYYLDPNRPQSGGKRAKITPKRFRLTAEPPEFEWK